MSFAQAERTNWLRGGERGCRPHWRNAHPCSATNQATVNFLSGAPWQNQCILIRNATSSKYLVVAHQQLQYQNRLEWAPRRQVLESCGVAIARSSPYEHL